MKELCIDARMLNASGIGTYLKNLLPYLDKHYKLLLLGNEEEISAIGLKNSEVIQMSSPIYSIREQYEFLLKIPRSDLFWSPHYNIPIFPIRTKKRIVTIHDVFHLKFSNTLTPAQELYAKFFLRWAAKTSHRIITVSHFSKKEILSHLQTPEQKIRVIHNGVSDLFQVIENTQKKNAARAKYGLPEKFILFVGNVKPHKNIANLIRAFASLKSDAAFQDYKLVITGKRKELITGAANLDAVINNSGLQSEVMFVEHIELQEMPVLYNLADLLVFPSLYEGFGLPPLEAMACGIPTLISDIECHREIYGNECMYVSPIEPESIKKGILTLLKDQTRRKDLVERGKEYVKKFTWETSANLHLNVFKETLKENER